MIAAIYTNTKDQVQINQQQKEQVQNMETVEEKKLQKSNNREIEELRQEVETLSQKIDNIQSSSTSNFKCRIQGILNNNQVDSATTEEAIQAARNGEEIVFVCTY